MMANRNPILIPELVPDDIVRFWRLVDKTSGQGPNGDCWIWRNSPHRGYGRINIRSGGKQIYYQAHRVAYKIQTGKDPGDKLVCHVCDYRLCVRGEHFFLGTLADNRADCVKKQRQARGNSQRLRKYPESRRFGRQNHASKFSEAALKDIRDNYTGKRGEQAAFARKYGVSKRAVWQVIHGLTRVHG